MWPARVLCLPPVGRGSYFAGKSFSLSSGNPRRTVCLYSTTPPSKNFGMRNSTHCVWRQFPASSPSLCPRCGALTREESFHKMRPHISPRCLLPDFGSHLSATAPAAASAMQGQQAAAAPGTAQQQQRRSMSSHEACPPELTRGTQGCMDIPVGGEGLYRRGTNIGMPMLFVMRYDRPTWQPLWEDEHEQIPRDGFGVPAHIPPEVSQDIKHVYHVPPQFYHFLKKLGDDTPALQPYMHKLINGEFTHDDYEEMFYKFAKPLKIYRKQIPMPYRTPEEVAREEEVAWEGAWLSYRQRVLASYNSAMYLRELLFGGLVGIYFAWVFLDGHRQYRLDMKLFYLEAPEHKVNWVKPRGDLV